MKKIKLFYVTKFIILMGILLSLPMCTTVNIYLTDQMANDFAPLNNGNNLKISGTFNHPSFSSPIYLAETKGPIGTAFFLTLLTALDFRWELFNSLAIDLSLFHQGTLFKIKQKGNFIISTGIERSAFWDPVYEIPIGFTYKIKENLFTWLNLKPGLVYVNKEVNCPDHTNITVNVNVTGFTASLSTGIGYIPPSGFFTTFYFSQIFPVKFPDSVYCPECKENIDVIVFHDLVIGIQLGWEFAFGKE